VAVVVSGVGWRILSAAGGRAFSLTPVGAYHDSLRDSPAGWTTSGQCQFQRDGYHVAGQNVCLAPLGMTPSDSTVEVTVTPWEVNAQTGFGIVLRHSDTNSFYAFEVTATGQWGVIFVHFGHGSLLAGFAQSLQIKRGLGSPNTLRVVAVGARFTFSVNGVQVATIHDTRLTSGDSGVFTDDNNSSSEVVFTDFAMTRAT
jgi:hypothetical protein